MNAAGWLPQLLARRIRAILVRLTMQVATMVAAACNFNIRIVRLAASVSAGIRMSVCMMSTTSNYAVPRNAKRKHRRNHIMDKR
jgi:hypothetical protein